MPETQRRQHHQGKERYSLGHAAAADVMAARNATGQAAFLLPYLGPGLSLLACGCGPGTITAGLAQAVAPGETVGVDMSEEQVEHAAELASLQGLTNARFQVANVYELPFPDDTFDAVFSNALMEHLSRPADALIEMRRVAKKGGVVAVRAAVHGLDLIEPKDPLLYQAFSLYEKVLKHNGGTPRIGKRLHVLMREADLSNVAASASHDYYGTREAIQRVADQVARLPVWAQAVALGLASESEADEISAAWGAWAEHPNAFLARTYGEALGWK